MNKIGEQEIRRVAERIGRQEQTPSRSSYSAPMPEARLPSTATSIYS